MGSCYDGICVTFIALLTIAGYFFRGFKSSSNEVLSNAGFLRLTKVKLSVVSRCKRLYYSTIVLYYTFNFNSTQFNSAFLFPFFSHSFAVRIAARSRHFKGSSLCWSSRNQLHSSWRTLTWRRAKATKKTIIMISPLAALNLES